MSIASIAHPPSQVTHLTSDVLAGIRHGFFGRTGGVSEGIFASLNAGFGSGDAPPHVAENRARIAAAMGASGARIWTVHQIHSDRVITLTQEPDWPAPPAAAPEADALVTATPGLCLGALHADCAPVLFADQEARVIGAAHSGWKGALGGILEATLAAMEALGAARGQIRAAIGPTISQRAYEVGPDFFDRFEAEDTDAPRFFAQGAGDRLQFDLPGYILHRLRGAGIGEAAWTGHCTHADPARFFSYRRACQRGEGDYGRLLSVIVL